MGSQSRFGPRPSLIDPWARSVATLASQTDLSVWDGYTDQAIEDHRESADYGAMVARSQDQGILHLDDLRSLAAIDAVVADLYAQYPADGESATFLASTYTDRELRPVDRRRRLERRIVYSTYHYTAQDPDLVARFARMGLNCSPELLANLHAAYDSMPPKLKPYYRNTQFKLTLNALPTEVRMLWRVEPVKEARDALPRPRCPLLPL